MHRAPNVALGGVMGRKLSISAGDIFNFKHGPLEVLSVDNHSSINVVYKKSKKRHKDFFDNVKNYKVNKESSCPYDRRINGVGYYGEGDYKIKNKTVPFSIWSNMIKRCYCEKVVIKDRRYLNVIVADEWHNAQNFARWHFGYSNYKDGFVLDKDLIGTSFLYSPDNCVYVPNEINIAIVLSYKSKHDPKLPVGVIKCKQTGLYACSSGSKNSLWGGRHKTPEQAFLKYCVLKNKQLNLLAEKYKKDLPPNAVNALKTFVEDRIAIKYE
jgi:hypothetical protein